MRSKGEFLVSAIWSGLILALGLALAFAESQVEASSSGGSINLMPLTNTLSAQQSYGTQIRIDPPMPSPNDVIRITASGDWFNVCVPRYQSHQIVGNVIRIDAVATLLGACIPVELPTSWSFTIEVGPLPVGLYTVEIYFTDSLLGSWRGATTSFLVSTERLYLPLILRNH